MKIASILPGLVSLLLLVSWSAAGAGDTGLTDQYDAYTSRMLQAYKKEQESCDVAGRELECLSAEYEIERVANHLDDLQGSGCTDAGKCGSAHGNFWGM
jgi:cytochrome c553